MENVNVGNVVELRCKIISSNGILYKEHVEYYIILETFDKDAILGSALLSYAVRVHSYYDPFGIPYFKVNDDCYLAINGTKTRMNKVIMKKSNIKYDYEKNIHYMDIEENFQYYYRYPEIIFYDNTLEVSQ